MSDNYFKLPLYFIKHFPYVDNEILMLDIRNHNYHVNDYIAYIKILRNNPKIIFTTEGYGIGLVFELLTLITPESFVNGCSIPARFKGRVEILQEEKIDNVTFAHCKHYVDISINNEFEILNTIEDIKKEIIDKIDSNMTFLAYNRVFCGLGQYTGRLHEITLNY